MKENAPTSNIGNEPKLKFFGNPESKENLEKLVLEHKIPRKLADKFLRDQGNELTPAGVALVVLKSVKDYLEEDYPEDSMISSHAFQLINSFFGYVDKLITDPVIAEKVCKEINLALPYLASLFPLK